MIEHGNQGDAKASGGWDVTSEGSGQNAFLMQVLAENVWIGDAIQAELKADDLRRVMEDELVG